jgi:hypothetical protein
VVGRLRNEYDEGEAHGALLSERGKPASCGLGDRDAANGYSHADGYAHEGAGKSERRVEVTNGHVVSMPHAGGVGLHGVES